MDIHDNVKEPIEQRSVLHHKVLGAIVVAFVVLASIQAAALPGTRSSPPDTSGVEACQFPTPGGYYACLNQSGDFIEYYNGCRYYRNPPSTQPGYLGCDL